MTTSTRFPTCEALADAKLEHGEKFEDREVGAALTGYAVSYLNAYRGDFSYLRAQQHQLGLHGYLSRSQIRGVLNCLLADRRHARTATQAKPLPLDDKAARFYPRPIQLRDGKYTVVLDDGERRTIKVSTTDPGPKGQVTFISFLAGPDNQNDYRCCGTIDRTAIGPYVWTYRYRNQAADSPLLRVVTYLLSSSYAQQHEAGVAWAHESGSCYVCGRELTTPESVGAGIGPVCAGRRGI